MIKEQEKRLFEHWQTERGYPSFIADGVFDEKLWTAEPVKLTFVLKEANCTEKGIRSFVCSCGSSKAESIELDMNNHTFRAVVIPATSTTQGYTAYTCVRCNYSYFDNYTPAIGH